ncbi:hypothetical protein CHS0354_016101 [Potamilus streckersoni]|uniref:CARD domain-containing protein n=1 Tax=Potamilus streckersoni TaxID=2493646 RepID=A0AAE0T0V9_9BIVA|nr:hypothetical protein CHS0354_016101 [Potamilus streckersoni]
MASGGNVKIHRTVLNRCLPNLVRDLDFKAVSIYIYQKELFDDITLRDISEQRVTSDKVRELILRLQQRDQNTYSKFKECLVLSKQEYLKDFLENEETKVYMEVNKKQKENQEKEKARVAMTVKEKHQVQQTGTAREIKNQDSFTMAVDTNAPVTVDGIVIKFCDETSHENCQHPDIYDRAALWMKSMSKDLPGPTRATVGQPANKTEYMQHSEQQQLSNYQEQLFKQGEPNYFQSKKRCDTQHEESMETDGFTQQTANYWGIYEKAQAWYDLAFFRKSRGYKSAMKVIRHEVSQNPVMKLRDITENNEPLGQSESLEIDGPTSTQIGGYLTAVKDNPSGSGPVICPSGMHHSKSNNDVHEGKVKECIGVSSSTPDLSSVSFIDGKIVLKEHYDVCIIFSDTDEDDVYTFIDHLEHIDLGGKEYPKICRFDDEGIWGLASKINRVSLVCNHCSVIFVFVSKNSFSDSYTRFFQDEVVMSSLKNCKVRPVLSEEDCSIPAGMQNIPPIKWYRRNTRAYKENIKSILDYSRKARLQRENNRVHTILPDFL